MSTEWTTGAWSRGPVEWTEGNTAFISVVFSWDVDKAFSRACWFRQAGFDVRVGGPDVFTSKRAAEFRGVAAVGGEIAGTQSRHNPMATKASEGCPVGCFFCIVPAMEGRKFTLLPDFEPRPVLTDNNLSALPAEYQRHIVDRYQAAAVPLLDANSGFEPKTFDGDVFERWRHINKGPWRFGLDETRETEDVMRVISMLKRNGVGARRIQPYVQPIIKLNARRKEPWVQHDWTAHRLRQVQRWVNRRVWRKTPFSEYRASIKTNDQRDRTAPLFEPAA